MGLLDKVKNLFTEEVEEEIKPIKNEVRHIEVEAPIRETREQKLSFEDEIEEEEKKEDKFVFFSDDDFKDLEQKEVKTRPIVPEEPKQMYRSTTIEDLDDKKTFKPSPIISPVYGVLDKNYSKEEVVTKKNSIDRPINRHLSVDDVRRKAYGTIEDDFKDTFNGDNVESNEVAEVSNIDIFEELEKYDKLDALQDKIDVKEDIDNKEIDVDEIFDSLDNKKEEILDELDTKKEEILDELDNKKEDIITNDNNLDDLDLDEETLELSRQLESQKQRLDEINDFIPENEEPITDEEPEKDDLNESELFDLIDSMYDKKDDE